MTTNSPEYMQQWRKAHPVAVRKHRHQTYLNQKQRDPEAYNDTATVRHDQWRKHNLERARQQQRKSYARYREENLVEKQIYARRHPDRIRANNARQRASRKGAPLSDPALAQEYIAILDGDPCAYCGSHDEIQIDHVIPIVRGGSHDWDNLTAACRSCNQSKHAHPDRKSTR